MVTGSLHKVDLNHVRGASGLAATSLAASDHISTFKPPRGFSNAGTQRRLRLATVAISSGSHGVMHSSDKCRVDDFAEHAILTDQS